MYIEKVSSWKWLVTPSQKSQRRRRYAVAQRRDGTFSCDCMSFRYGTKECKHIQAIKELMQTNDEHPLLGVI